MATERHGDHGEAALASAGLFAKWRRDSNAPVAVSSAVLVFAISGLVGLALVSVGVADRTQAAVWAERRGLLSE